MSGARSQDGSPAAEDSTTGPVGRRALLRRAAGLAAAGLGGIAAAEMLSAGSASAASGDPLLAGTANDAGADQTALTSSTTAGSTLKLSHSGGGAPVLLSSSGSSGTFAPASGLFKGGELLNLTDSGAQTLFWWSGDNVSTEEHRLDNLAVVLTTATGTVFAPITADRILDTRTTSGRALIVSTTGILDSSHRLKAGKTLQIDLSAFVKFAYSVHFNLMVIGALGAGYATAYGMGGRPAASSIHYAKTAPIHNSGIAALDTDLVLSIYSEHTAHVVLDVQGWTMPDFSFLLDDGSAARRAQAVAGGSRHTRDLGVVARAVPRRTNGEG